MREYNLNEGIQKAEFLIKEKLLKLTNPVFVKVAGGSSSGKTSKVAAKLVELFHGKAVMLSMDDYYRDKSFKKEMAKKGFFLNWDQPEILELELLQKHLKDLEARLVINKPIYNFKTGEREGYEKFYPAPIIIIEGLFALDGSLLTEGDIKIFVDTGTHGRMLRRLFRDIERTNNRPKDILRYFAEIVEPMHEKYVLSTKKNADIIIKNEYNHVIEAKNSGLHEVQLKFWVEWEGEIINRPGVIFLEKKIQSDCYYNPKDRNLMETGEILRIRRENNDKIIFTYEGPKEKHKFRKRPKFEFEIDEETEKSFLAVCGDMVKAIRKVRDLYQYKNIVFSIDSVVSYENGVMRPLGKFVEIRLIEKELDFSDIKREIEMLGLKIYKYGITRSYFEM